MVYDPIEPKDSPVHPRVFSKGFSFTQEEVDALPPSTKGPGCLCGCFESCEHCNTRKGDA